MLSKMWIPKGGSKNLSVRTQTQDLPRARVVVVSSVEIHLDQHAMMYRKYLKSLPQCRRNADLEDFCRIWRNPAPDNGLIASGVAKGGDAKFVPDWQPQGRVALGIGKNGSNVRFADLNGDGVGLFRALSTHSGLSLEILP